MAKIHQEVVQVVLSKLVKENDQSTSLISDDLNDALVAVAEEIAGDGVIVEIVKTK